MMSSEYSQLSLDIGFTSPSGLSSNVMNGRAKHGDLWMDVPNMEASPIASGKSVDSTYPAVPDLVDERAVRPI